MNSQRPGVILFDAAGTLFHLPRGVGAHYADVARRFGAAPDAAALDAAFRAAWKTMPPPAETSGPRNDDDRGWWRALVSRVLDTTGTQIDREAYFPALWEEFIRPGVWELYPETLEVLTTLGQRFRLGVVSNFDSRLHRILAVLGIAHFFEHVIVSSEVGADKPSPRIFREALDRFDTTTATTLHVGDDPDADWRGAASAGLQIFELRRPHNSLCDLPPALTKS